jgi:hypothetical protein
MNFGFINVKDFYLTSYTFVSAYMIGEVDTVSEILKLDFEKLGLISFLSFACYLLWKLIEKSNEKFEDQVREEKKALQKKVDDLETENKELTNKVFFLLENKNGLLDNKVFHGK